MGCERTPRWAVRGRLQCDTAHRRMVIVGGFAVGCCRTRFHYKNGIYFLLIFLDPVANVRCLVF